MAQVYWANNVQQPKMIKGTHYATNGIYTNTTTANQYIQIVQSGSGGTNTQMAYNQIQPIMPREYTARSSGRLAIMPGQPAVIELPDGAVIDVKADGSYEIKDDDAKITYKANRVREFNRYVNASDLLEEFIDYVDGVGEIDKHGFLNLPIELFIQWLVLRAAESDGDEAPEQVEAIHLALTAPKQLALPAPKPHRNCKCCGRFVSRLKADNGMLFCTVDHFARFEAKLCS